MTIYDKFFAVPFLPSPFGFRRKNIFELIMHLIADTDTDTNFISWQIQIYRETVFSNYFLLWIRTNGIVVHATATICDAITANRFKCLCKRHVCETPSSQFYLSLPPGHKPIHAAFLGILIFEKCSQLQLINLKFLFCATSCLIQQDPIQRQFVA